jgi:hypothetical protein
MLLCSSWRKQLHPFIPMKNPCSMGAGGSTSEKHRCKRFNSMGGDQRKGGEVFEVFSGFDMAVEKVFEIGFVLFVQ